MDSRKELSLIEKHILQHNREAGESIFWFEFRPRSATAGSAGTLFDDVYDEGVAGSGGRSYASGIVIPTIYVEEREDLLTLQEEGRQPVQNLNVTMLYRDVVAAGMSSPDEFKGHLNDLFFYDSRYYKVWEYVVRGRLPSPVVVSVRGVEVFLEQEFPFDPGPPTIAVTDLPWPSTFPSHSV